MNGEIDLRYCLRLIARRKKFIVTGTLICLIIAGGISFVIPKTYRSSLLLEIGRIYLSKMAVEERQFIEDPDTVAAVVRSDGILERIRRELKLDLRLEKMRKRLGVETFVQEMRFKGYLPVLELSYESGSPREAVEVLNSLAESVVDRHREEFDLYRSSLEAKIEYGEEKIAAMEKIAAAQSQYKELTQKYIDRGGVGAEEFRKELSGLEGSPGTSAIDLLFLQSSSLTGEIHITDLTKFKAGLDGEIARNRKEIADTRAEIVNYRTLIELSSPTEIRTPAVLPEFPGKPNRGLVIIIGGVLGLALTILIVLFREYLKE